MDYETLKLKWEMCLEKIEEQGGEILVLERELKRTQAALKLIDDGLHILNSISMVNKPSEYETLFKDYAPFNNIMAAYFPAEKKQRKAKNA